jgi:hypothetical protein
VVPGQGTLSRLDAVLPAVVILMASGGPVDCCWFAGLNSIPDGSLSSHTSLSMITVGILVSAGFVAMMRSTKGKVINVKLKVQTRHAWLASALSGGFFAIWKLALIAGSG